MKKTIVLVAIFLTATLSANAQDNKETGMYFGAIIGTKYNNFNNHFIADIEPELYAFSLGAGAAWTKNNYVIGLDFLYSNANKDNNAGDIQYIGFTNTLWFGYNLSKSKTWKIEPNLGVVVNNNQLIAQNKLTISFKNLTNNQVMGNIGLNIKVLRCAFNFISLKSINTV